MVKYVSFVGQRPNIVKLLILAKSVMKVSAIPIKIPLCSVEIDKVILKSIWKCKAHTIAKMILKIKNRSWRMESTLF